MQSSVQTRSALPQIQNRVTNRQAGEWAYSIWKTAKPEVTTAGLQAGCRQLDMCLAHTIFREHFN